MVQRFFGLVNKSTFLDKVVIASESEEVKNMWNLMVEKPLLLLTTMLVKPSALLDDTAELATLIKKAILSQKVCLIL